MGLYLHKGKYFEDKKTIAICTLHVITAIGGSFMAIAGTYTTIQSIVDAYKLGSVAGAFSCS